MGLHKSKSRVIATFTSTLATALAGLCLVACASKQKTETPQNAPSSAKANAPADNHFDGGTYCAQTFLQGPAPAQPLHFSYKVTESDQSLKSKDYEADLAGDNVDLVHHDTWLATDEDRAMFQETAKFDDPKVITRVIKDGIANETIMNHATRSDAVSWRGVTTGMAQGGTPWHLFLDRPPVSRIGTETVSGFETIKYAVGTTKEDAIDKGALKAFAHLQDYNITGTAWVMKDANCVLQYDITYEETSNDGKSRKTHYEGAITKK